MKTILKLAALLVLPSFAMGAFPTNSCVSTSRVDLIKGGFDSFRWDWNGYEDQNCRICVMDSSSTYVTLTGYYGAFKVAKKTGAGQTAYISLTADEVTVSGSNLTFSVAYTNIPKDGEYLCEAWLYSGTTTNIARVVAQGKINSHMSLYATDDSTFPWPTNNDTFAYYVPYTDTVYSASVTGLSVSAGAAFAASVASHVGTLTYPANTVTGLTGDTEFVIAGSGHAITGSIGSAIARDTEVTSAATANTNYTDATVAAYVPTNSFVANLRCKKLTGTTAEAEGGSTDLAHGVTLANIVGVQVLVQVTSILTIPPNFTKLNGYQFDVLMNASNVGVFNHSTNSENILGKAITVLLWYTQ